MWPHFKAKPFAEGLEEDVGKVSFFSLASHFGSKFYGAEWNPITALQHPWPLQQLLGSGYLTGLLQVLRPQADTLG